MTPAELLRGVVLPREMALHTLRAVTSVLPRGVFDERLNQRLSVARLAMFGIEVETSAPASSAAGSSVRPLPPRRTTSRPHGGGTGCNT